MLKYLMDENVDPPKQTIGQALDDLVLAAEVAYRDEYRDRIVNLPLT